MGLIIFQSVLLLVLVVLSAFFSSTEVAYFSLNPLQVRRLKEKSEATARQVEWILSSPTRLLSTVLVGNTMVNVAISSVAYLLAEDLGVPHAETVAVSASLFMLLIFGEIGPKRIAMSWAEPVASFYAPIVTFFIRLLTPLRLFVERTTVAFAHLFLPQGRILSEEEFATVVDVSSEEGVLDEEERLMVRGIIRLERLKASDVMTPRVDIIGIDLNDPGPDLRAAVLKARVRYVLLYRDQLDTVEGFLDVRRFLLDPQHRIQAALVSPMYVPEPCPLDRLLAQFLKEKQRAAVVVDEYGGTAGIVTRGDVIEEVTGDIEDEQGGHELLFESIRADRWLIDGQVSLATIRNTVGIELEEEGVDRIAGWISTRLERMPRPGDSVEGNGFRILVRQMRRNRIALVELIRTAPSP